MKKAPVSWGPGRQRSGGKASMTGSTAPRATESLGPSVRGCRAKALKARRVLIRASGDRRATFRPRSGSRPQ